GDRRAAELHHHGVERGHALSVGRGSCPYGTRPSRRYGRSPGGSGIPSRSAGSGTGSSAVTTRGRCPAQTSSSASGVSPSSGPPSLIFADDSSSGMRSTEVALSSFG